MRVKIMGSVLVALFFLTAFAYTQEWPSVEDVVTKIQSALDLSDGQIGKVRVIIKDNLAKRQKISPQLTAGLTQAQAEPLDLELYTKLSQVLTRPQMNQWEGMKEGILDKRN